MRGVPFRRVSRVFDAIAALIASAGFAAMAGVEQQLALQSAGSYDSNGHGRGRRFSPGNGSTKVRRAARKARNVKRHKAHCRRKK